MGNIIICKYNFCNFMFIWGFSAFFRLFNIMIVGQQFAGWEYFWMLLSSESGPGV